MSGKGFFHFLKERLLLQIKFVHFAPSSFSNIFSIPFKHIAFLFFFLCKYQHVAYKSTW